MKSIACALLFLSLFTLSTTPVLAASSTKNAKAAVAADPIKDATVNLYCRLKAGKTIYSPSGSGVFISDRGVILTNAHVAQYFLLAGEKGRVTGWCSVRTGSPADETYTAEILYISPTWLSDNVSKISEKRPRGTGENDFALLYVTGAEKKKALPAKFPSLPIATAAQLLEKSKVTVAGYPVAGLDFSDVRNKLSAVTDSSTVTNTQSFTNNMQPELITLTTSNSLTFGVSGGPVLDASNAVAALVVTKSTSETDQKLRAISLPYIDRTLRAQTGVSLSGMLAGDFKSRAAITRLLLPSTIVADLMKGFRAKSK